MEVASRRGPFHLRLAADELAGKPVPRILHVRPVVHTKPAHIERHDSRHRRRAAAKERVDKVVEIEDVNIVGLQDCVARAGIDAANTVRG